MPSTSKFCGKTKGALIKQLLGVQFSDKVGGSTADGERLSTTHLMEMVRQLQQDQRAWLEAQQRMQEEVMVRNQKAQKETLDAIVSASRASVESPPPIASERERVKPPKPILQKLSKEDDIESCLDMFERVAGQHG